MDDLRDGVYGINYRLCYSLPSNARFNFWFRVGLHPREKMDKLRAIEYFVASAEERSFTRAARRLEVSVPAIAKLIGNLEKRSALRSSFARRWG
jgi:hypothetical protein